MLFLKDFLEKINFDFFWTNFRLVLYVCKFLCPNFVFLFDLAICCLVNQWAID